MYLQHYQIKYFLAVCCQNKNIKPALAQYYLVVQNMQQCDHFSPFQWKCLLLMVVMGGLCHGKEIIARLTFITYVVTKKKGRDVQV